MHTRETPPVYASLVPVVVGVVIASGAEPVSWASVGPGGAHRGSRRARRELRACLVLAVRSCVP